MNRQEFFAACANPGCGRSGVCLPATHLDRTRKTHIVMARANWVTTGFWTATGSFYIYTPEGVPLRTALRRHQKAAGERWQPVCVRCIGAAYMKSARFDKARGHWIDSIFGLELSAALAKARASKNPDRALDRLIPRLEAEILRVLKWFATPRSRRRPTPYPDCLTCLACGTILKATELRA